MTKKIVTMAEATSFLSGRGTWSSLEKRAKKVIERGLDEIETLLDKADLDDKTRLLAADKLTSYGFNIVEANNKDRITRMIAEIKLIGQLPNGGSTEDDDNSPLICFDTIQDVG
jgi:hypothetical protein